MSLSLSHVPAGTAQPWSDGGDEPRLSTDYLNRYGEALMLLEMAAEDPSLAGELADWRPVGYVEHFSDSALRCADGALAAYRALDPARRAAFDGCCDEMADIVVAAVALAGALPRQGTPEALGAHCEALRERMGHATRFINANGLCELGEEPAEGLSQNEIDSLFA